MLHKHNKPAQRLSPAPKPNMHICAFVTVLMLILKEVSFWFNVQWHLQVSPMWGALNYQMFSKCSNIRIGVYQFSTLVVMWEFSLYLIFHLTFYNPRSLVWSHVHHPNDILTHQGPETLYHVPVRRKWTMWLCVECVLPNVHHPELTLSGGFIFIVCFCNHIRKQWFILKCVK